MSQLPDYMVPSAFIFLDKLPLTPGGKIDRNALPTAMQNQSKNEYVPTRNPIEEVVAGVWEEVLLVEEVSVHDNFFDLGGHSLQVIRVVSRIREIFQVELHLRSLFESPTIAELALQIQKAIIDGQHLHYQPIQQVVREGNLPLSFAQQRLWFLDQLEPGNFAYNVPAAVRLEGRLDIDALERTINEVIQRHEVLRTSFQAFDGHPVQVISSYKPLRLEVEELSELQESEREIATRRITNEELKRPFMLNEGPLFRVRLLRLGREEHVAIYTLHHIICDGWSMGILIKEIVEIYLAFSNGQNSPLSIPQIQYADFAHWQRKWLQDGALESQLAYWKKELNGTLPVLNLAVNGQRSSGATDTGARQSFRISAELTQALKALSRREGSTLFMTMFAAFNILLYRYSGQNDIIVGVANANRSRHELEGLIGFFVNMLALRTRLSEELVFLELLRGIRRTTLNAYAHQDVPFEKVVEALQLERSPDHTPIFQIAFGLQNAPIQPISLPGFSITPLEQEHEAARYDLTLWISEIGNEMSASWTYNARLFDAETVKRMHNHFINLMNHIVIQPDSRLSDLNMQSDAERKLETQEGSTLREHYHDSFLSVKPQIIKVIKS